MTTTKQDTTDEAGAEDTGQDTGNQVEQQNSGQVEQQNAEQDEAEKPNAEAARRRRQLREVQAERDELRLRVDQYERLEVEQYAAERLENPKDLWLVDVALDDLKDETGIVNVAKLTETLDGILEARPHWAKVKRPGTPRPDRRQGGGRRDVGGSDGWSGALRGRH